MLLDIFFLKSEAKSPAAVMFDAVDNAIKEVKKKKDRRISEKMKNMKNI
jgi:hypothetical protein